ncbi:MAG: DUF3365 domain-containing protein [Eggerthellaceae bacterium]|nr:DUF3365 domain-containing protein [Eggerthellaceae bacterium]
MKSQALKTKIALVLGGVFVVAMVLHFVWDDMTARRQMEAELQERGRVIALQMQQIWNFLVLSQDADAQYAYTAIQDDNCAVAGREISVTFTDSSNYVTRYVSDAPRNPADTPDMHELAAIKAFKADETLAFRGAITEYDGKQVYRYLEPMRITEICMECHGGPKGEIDITGYPKEGLALGDVVGAVSIVVPMDTFVENRWQDAARNIAIFGILLALALVVIYLFLNRLVTKPVAVAQNAFLQVGEGDLGVRMPEDLRSREMNDLAYVFNVSAENLAAAYNGLEDEIQDRTLQLQNANAILEEQRAKLEEANERLRSENRYKSDFLTIVSHELRTPLTSILSFTELLKDDPSLDAQGETARREIETNSRVLLLMINDILEMSRLDAGRMQLNPETMDVCELMDFVEAVVSPIAARADVEFGCTATGSIPLIEGDFDKLAHALENLAFNAVKFTPSGGHVTMEARSGDGGRTVRIAVADTGIGIAPEDRERIFEPFAQADSALVRRYNGTGLGLPLAKEIVELHGGHIELESTLGEGSTFTIVLPASDGVPGKFTDGTESAPSAKTEE